MPGTGRRQGHISGCKPDSRPGAPGTQTVVVPVSAAATWRPCPLALLPASCVPRAGPMSTFPAPHILSPGPTPRGQRSCCRRAGEREAKNERKERRSGRRPIMILLLAYFFSFQFHTSDFQCHRKQRGAGHDIYHLLSVSKGSNSFCLDERAKSRILSYPAEQPGQCGPELCPEPPGRSPPFPILSLPPRVHLRAASTLLASNPRLPFLPSACLSFQAQACPVPRARAFSLGMSVPLCSGASFSAPMREKVTAYVSDAGPRDSVSVVRCACSKVTITS